MLLHAGAISTGGLTLLLTTCSVLLAAMGTAVMLGPNRRGKKLDNAETSIEIAYGRADRAEKAEARARADATEARARAVELERRVEQLLRDNRRLVRICLDHDIDL